MGKVGESGTARMFPCANFRHLRNCRLPSAKPLPVVTARVGSGSRFDCHLVRTWPSTGENRKHLLYGDRKRVRELLSVPLRFSMDPLKPTRAATIGSGPASDLDRTSLSKSQPRQLIRLSHSSEIIAYDPPPLYPLNPTRAATTGSGPPAIGSESGNSNVDFSVFRFNQFAALALICYHPFVAWRLS